ncbi:hypothetical protein J8M97_00690 [Gordonia polyisoprenivorans]|uniref:hypothetical protein n=1 Tax=Gordonia polyisoprenivorans TaxID=84595 RepID=UPI001B8C7490|nr:hypothetical protein [Gordonia polyisoprenivorans]QUD85923.1 hypothetical protein J8M97_00690 [Gordonia polyisoprenivorans]
MTVSTMTGLVSHGDRAITRWFRTRWNLTPEERHNLRMSCTPVAVVTASLGGRVSVPRQR